MMHHPNRQAFEGVLTYVDRKSDNAPSGARGHRVILTRAAAETAIPGLIGMGVNYKSGWDGHDARRKVGVIETAELDGDALAVGGYLFARDFPEVVATVKRGGTSRDALGMSYELADAHVADMRAKAWTLTRFTFTGAAVLLRDRAAYRKTSFRLVQGSNRLSLAASGLGMRSIVDDDCEEICEEGEAREEAGEREEEACVGFA
jgi:hypothetical protein